MAPTPQETVVGEREVPKTMVQRPLSGEEVVISGMSGIFPKSNSVSELMDNLFNKVDMVSSDDPRWVFNHPEVPEHLGKVQGMGKFDAQFFRVHYKQACTMEPMSRKLLEHAYSAIYDSGINPLQLRGKKVGVFIGSTFSESEKIVIYENIQRNGFGITGCNKAMYANRISYWIDGKGPSYALDLACSSATACLEHAYRCISTGQCDAAIVGGCNLCMHPNVSLNLKRAGFLCLDGKTKCFNKNGDGYVRSDAISVLFVQKAKDAKRIYSEIYYAKGNYSLRPDAEFLPIRQSRDIQEFLEEFYAEIGVSPKEVEYVEACGSAIAEADSNELDAISKVFAKDKPVKVGCVKSNMGHSEPASGACSATKVCLAYHKGEIPANLHYDEPMDQVPGVRDGSIQVLTEHTPFNRGFTALNSFSYTGANVHILLKGHHKEKDLERYKSSLPRLVMVSGRQESSVEKILDLLKSQPIDPEQIGLMHSIHESDIPGHLSRGFTILDTNETNETVSLSQSTSYYDGVNRPLWFVYSGMGSQWAGMGADLMRIPTFSAAIERCRRVLEPKGIDIVKILTDPDKTIYDNILHSFVGIAAVQIGLTDILNELGIVPDNIIGHSVGELGCAYADGCFTAEEMILSAYSRGLVSVQTPFIKGSMAAVGLGYKAVLPLCPPEIEVACHNSSESSTISGPAEIMKEFVGNLTKKGIFAKEVPCSNIAYHSKYIAGAGPGLLKFLSEVIKDPKPRSDKWVSTSVPQEQWETPIAKYSSAEYHTNNLLNSVLFEETSKLIPSNALVIEIAPHGLLQAILKRSHAECIHLPLTRRGHQDPVKFFLEAVGKMYQSGLNPKVEALYPRIQFPVSTKTPLLSHFVEWVHTEDWPQAKYNTAQRVTTASRTFVMAVHDEDFKHYSGHIRDGVNIFPEAAILVLVWETLAMSSKQNFEALSVIFQDVQFFCEARLKTNETLRFHITIHKGNLKFEVSYRDTKLASGIVIPTKNDLPYRQIREENLENDVFLSAKDIYKIFGLRGLTYKGEFQSLHCTKGDTAYVKWNNDWVTLIDSLIQLSALNCEHDGVTTPKIITKLTINHELHKKEIPVALDGENCLKAEYYGQHQIIRCGGVELDGIVFNKRPVIEETSGFFETRSFISHFLTGNVDVHRALQINLQIVADNVENKITVTEFVEPSPNVITDYIKEVADQIPTAEFDIHLVHKEKIELDSLISREHVIGKSDLYVVYNLLGDEKKMKNLHNILSKNNFVLALEQDTTKIHPKYKLFNVITAMSVQKQIFILLKKADVKKENVIYLPIAHDSKFNWVPRVVSELQKTRHVTLVSERQPFCGILGMVQKLKKQYGNKISVVVVDDYHAPSFNPENAVFKEQLQKNLTFNVLKQGQWGGYYSLSGPRTCMLRNVSLSVTVPGDLDTLTWIEAPVKPASNNLVQVCFSALSFKDAEKAVGRPIIDDHDFGMDFSGIDNKGERVMGLVQGGSLSSTVEADSGLLWPVPEHWTLEDAATVPLPYAITYYALAIRCKLLKGMNVFVNGGVGALGQAVISVCLAAGCQVYTAVSEVRKKRFLMKLFPKLEEQCIGNSRDWTAMAMVSNLTNGDMCSIVINCVSGEAREAAMQCLGMSGMFIDLASDDITDNKEFGMNFLIKERNYCMARVSTLFKSGYEHEKKMVQAMISEGIKNGAVRPLSRIVFPPIEVPRAFRLVSSSRHRGRVVMKMKDPETMSHGIHVTPRITYSSKCSYVVVCDESGVGVELADRLVKQGARNLTIHIKPNSIAGYFCTKLAKWRKLGVSIKISSDNLQTEKGCVNLLKEGTKLGPIEGLFIVQDSDSIEKNLEQQQFVETFNARSLVVINLDLVSRNLCGEMRYFAVLMRSSQSVTEEFTNSVSEKICRSRNEIGLPALAFRVESLKEFDQNQDLQKVKPQSLAAAFSALESSLKLKYSNVVSFDLKIRKRTEFLQKISKILGVENIDKIDENLTIKSFILNKINIEEIQSIINETYSYDFPLETVKNMSISRIKSLEDSLVTVNTKFNSGLGAFYSFIDEDECMATEPMVSMPTLLTNASEKEEELDPKETYLMLIPGFEGHHRIFESICERVKVPAMTFQLSPDSKDDNVQQIAANIMKFMKKRFELKSKFYLFGYSFGVNVALELAALIEQEGHVGVVYCLDSSPDALRVQLNAYLGNLSNAELQSSIVQHMYQLMAGVDSNELKQDLAVADTWNDKMEACVNRLRGLVNYSNQYKRCIMEAAYNRILNARDYEPNFKLESEIVLMKAIPHPNSQQLPEDYNLSKYTKRPVKIFHLESDHAFAPNDCRVSNIVNTFLETKVLEELKSKSLCETYLADPSKVL